jgi:hypothetical protein
MINARQSELLTVSINKPQFNTRNTIYVSKITHIQHLHFRITSAIRGLRDICVTPITKVYTTCIAVLFMVKNYEV